jgi:hypothetical protein
MHLLLFAVTRISHGQLAIRFCPVAHKASRWSGDAVCMKSGGDVVEETDSEPKVSLRGNRRYLTIPFQPNKTTNGRTRARRPTPHRARVSCLLFSLLSSPLHAPCSREDIPLPTRFCPFLSFDSKLAPPLLPCLSPDPSLRERPSIRRCLFVVLDFFFHFSTDETRFSSKWNILPGK